VHRPARDARPDPRRDVDTSFFTGNYPTHCSIDAIDTPRPLPSRLLGAGGPPWTTVLAKTALNGDAHNYIPVTDDRPWTHVRLNIYPDGGVARLRVYGDVEVDWDRAAPPGRVVDLAFIRHGGIVLAVSDMHYGAKDNMLMPGRAKDMRDGWETRGAAAGPATTGRSCGSARPGEFAGSRSTPITSRATTPIAPRRRLPGAGRRRRGAPAAPPGPNCCPQSKLHPHHRHIFHTELRRAGPVSHVRLNIFPDGGVSRLRVHGTLADTR
jgi:allantoicase